MSKFSHFAAALALATCGMANAYDATADFLTLSNPNGVWQYGYSAGNGIYSFTEFDTPFSEGGAFGWRSSTYQLWGAPAIWKNMTGSTSNGVENGQLSLHSGPEPFRPTILRFVTPTTGFYSYWVEFFEGDSGVMRGSVFVNGNLGEPVVNFPSTNGNPSIGGSIALNAGDFFDVAVSTDSGFLDGNTPVQVNIVAEIPEPRTTALLAAGAAALLLMRRRLKRV